MESGNQNTASDRTLSESGARLRLLERPELTGLRDEWDHLVDSSALPSPFLKSWWVENAASGTPIFALVVDDGGLVGGTALEVDRLGTRALGVRRVRSVGQRDLAPDHLDVLAAPGRRGEVLAALAGWLRRGNWVVDLDGLAAESELPWLLDAPVVSTIAAPYLPVSPTAPLGHLPGRLRSTIKRSGRRLAKAGFETVRVTPERAVEAVATLLALHESRWADESALGARNDALSRALVAGSAVGDVVLHEMTDGSTVIASEVELLAGARACFYQAGRLTDHEFRGSGSVLKADILRWAAEAGYTEFDLLRGEDPYKEDWALATRTVRRVRTGFGLLGTPAAASMNQWKRAAPVVQRLSWMPTTARPQAN